MGLQKWLAKKGAPGLLARYSAKKYIAISNGNPGIEETELFKEIVLARLVGTASEKEKIEQLRLAEESVSLKDLVFKILDYENSFTEGGPKAVDPIMDAMFEEIDRFSLPKAKLDANENVWVNPPDT